jgi:hypothetical protein
MDARSGVPPRISRPRSNAGSAAAMFEANPARKHSAEAALWISRTASATGSATI